MWGVERGREIRDRESEREGEREKRILLPIAADPTISTLQPLPNQQHVAERFARGVRDQLGLDAAGPRGLLFVVNFIVPGDTRYTFTLYFGCRGEDPTAAIRAAAPTSPAKPSSSSSSSRTTTPSVSKSVTSSPWKRPLASPDEASAPPPSGTTGTTDAAFDTVLDRFLKGSDQYRRQ